MVELLHELNKEKYGEKRMMFQTKESLIRPNWTWVGIWAFGALMFCSGVMFGRNSIEPEASVRSVPFATLEDMRFLVAELRVCKETLSEYDIHVESAEYE